MILSILEYGDVIYDCANQTLLTDLQTSHEVCNINELKERRTMHLTLYMFKQKGNVDIVNTRNVRTRAHDAISFTKNKPNNEKYKRNVLYKGALAWNALPVIERNIEKR